MDYISHKYLIAKQSWQNSKNQKEIDPEGHTKDHSKEEETHLFSQYWEKDYQYTKDHKEFFHDEEINRNSSYLPIPWNKKDHQPEEANRKNVNLVVLMNELLYFEHWYLLWTLAIDGCPRFVLLFQLDHSL